MTPNQTRTGLFETPRGQSKAEPGFTGRSSVSEIPKTKAVPATFKIKRPVRSTTSKPESGSHPPLKSSRNSVDLSPGSAASADRSPRSVTSLDRSPRSVDSKIPSFSSKVNSISDRPVRVAKKSDLQTELNAAKEELKEANEQLVYLEKEKAQAFEELEEAKRQVDEAYEQLTVAIASQKEAEEKIEIEKFRIVELEQTGIEAAQHREEYWQKEVESIRNQHALDVSALLSANQELERLKHELAMTTEAKNAATAHADDALKIAEIHAEKVGILSAEVNRLKALLDSKLENAAKETAEHARRLEVEIDALRDELRRAREAEKKLGEMEILVNGLKVDITNAQKAKSDAEALVIEWKKKAKGLEVKVDEAIQSEKVASDSLASAVKQLEDCNASLRKAESEIVCLKGEVESLEVELARHKDNLNETNSNLEAAKSEILEMENIIPSLKSKINIMEEEKNQALDHNTQIASTIPTLVEEKNKFAYELKASKEEVENAKKAVEGLTSALQEATAEAKESQEQLQMKQVEVTDAQCQIDELNKALKSTEEKYKVMLIETRSEVSRLKSMVEVTGMEAKDLKSERSAEEDSYISSIKKSEEEIIEIKEEMDKLVHKLKGTEDEAAAAKEEGIHLLSRLEQATQEVKTANEAAEEARVVSVQLKERLLDKENELQSITQENYELRVREEEANKKISELSNMLEEALLKKDKKNVIMPTTEEAEFTSIVEGTDDIPKLETPPRETNEEFQMEERILKEVKEVTENGSQRESTYELEDKNEVGSNLVNRVLSPEKEPEPPAPIAARLNSKSGHEAIDQRIDEMSPTREQHEKKKKFLSKFGGLLKKKTHH